MFKNYFKNRKINKLAKELLVNSVSNNNLTNINIVDVEKCLSLAEFFYDSITPKNNVNVLPDFKHTPHPPNMNEDILEGYEKDNNKKESKSNTPAPQKPNKNKRREAVKVDNDIIKTETTTNTNVPKTVSDQINLDGKSTKEKNEILKKMLNNDGSVNLKTEKSLYTKAGLLKRKPGRKPTSL